LAQPTPEQAAKIESDYILPDASVLPDAGAPSSASASVKAPPPAATQQMAAPIQQRLNGAVHAQLTVQLRMYVEKQGKMPDTFSEFVNGAMDSVPAAPDGMKFVIDSTDRSVKVVRK
jgi:hypothetical protein